MYANGSLISHRNANFLFDDYNTESQGYFHDTDDRLSPLWVAQTVPVITLNSVLFPGSLISVTPEGSNLLIGAINCESNACINRIVIIISYALTYSGWLNKCNNSASGGDQLTLVNLKI